MTPPSQGDVVLVPFPFSDLSTVKRRPALVLSSDEFNRTLGDLIIAQISSRVNSPTRPGDHFIRDWRAAGLLLPSLVRAQITTINSSIVVKVLGSMPGHEMAAARRQLAGVLGFS